MHPQAINQNLNYANPQSLALGNDPTIGISDDPGVLKNDTGIDMGALINEWTLASEHVRLYTRDFKFLDDLVDGVPLNHQDGNPFVGDMTLAGLVHSIPRDSIQNLPGMTMEINGSKTSVPAILGSYLLRHFAFNDDTFGKSLLNMMWLGGEQALTHGYAPFMVATGQMFNNFGTTLKLLHYMDNAPEPGIQDHNETGYDYVVANLTPSRVRKILRAARNNPSTTWNVQALKQVLTATPQPPMYSIYEGAAKRNTPGEESGPVYQFITRYETGPNPTIVTFCPQAVREVPLRVMESKSKFGYPRVMYLVIDPAALTPFGISRVRLASPNQNLMNIYYANIASMLLLNSKPPIFQKGRFSTPVTLKQGAVWKAIDPQASAQLMNMDNGALNQFVPMAQQFSGQIQTVMGRAPMTGPQGTGKTTTGVEASQQQSDTAVNQITKIYEAFLRQYALVALDVLLCEQEGEEDIIVDDDTKNALNDIQPGFVGDDNKVHMDWDRFYAAIEQWHVEITVSVSQDQMNDKKRADIQDMLTVLAQNAQELGPEAIAMVQKLANMLLQDQVPLAGSMMPSGGAPATPVPPAGQVQSPLPLNPAVAGPQ
jgi:hypothetical protein